VEQPYRSGQIVRVPGSRRVLYAQWLSSVTNPNLEVFCWARPLVIIQGVQTWDVRQGMDVIWPRDWFSPAYDQEVLDLFPFLDWEEVVYLGPSKTQMDILQDFVQELYRDRYHPHLKKN